MAVLEAVAMATYLMETINTIPKRENRWMDKKNYKHKLYGCYEYNISIIAE